MQKLIDGAAKLGLSLGEREVGLFQTYYRELVDWNQRMNLTSITEYDAVQINHFLDSLTVALIWKPDSGRKQARVLDVGTGAGLPGIALKIVFPEIRLVLLEATTKKTEFLHHLKRILDLNDIDIVAGRAEDVAHLSQYREKFDLVLARAVAAMPALVELTLPFCSIGGRFVAYKKGDIKQELAESSRAIDLMGGKLDEVKQVNLSEFPDQRYLISVLKLKPTPGQYPRSPGTPAHKPIK